MNQFKNIFLHIEYAISEISEKIQENNNEFAISGTSDLEVNSEDKNLDIPENDIPNELDKRGGGKREEGEEKVERVDNGVQRKGKRKGSRKGRKRKHRKRDLKNVSKY